MGMTVNSLLLFSVGSQRGLFLIQASLSLGLSNFACWLSSTSQKKRGLSWSAFTSRSIISYRDFFAMGFDCREWLQSFWIHSLRYRTHRTLKHASTSSMATAFRSLKRPLNSGNWWTSARLSGVAITTWAPFRYPIVFDMSTSWSVNRPRTFTTLAQSDTRQQNILPENVATRRNAKFHSDSAMYIRTVALHKNSLCTVLPFNILKPTCTRDFALNTFCCLSQVKVKGRIFPLPSARDRLLYIEPHWKHYF